MLSVPILCFEGRDYKYTGATVVPEYIRNEVCFTTLSQIIMDVSSVCSLRLILVP